MNTELDTKVGELVMARPETMRYFERLGIDYCCGGHRSLAEACQLAHQDPEEVLKGLATVEIPTAGVPSLRDWTDAPLGDLIQHIVATHHDYLREEMPRLEMLLEKVLRAHGERHPELERVGQLYRALVADLMPHMMKEEQILFPFIRQMEQGQTGSSCFGSVQSPIRVMEMEHEAVGALLTELRDLTGAYTTPADGCATFRALYDGLETLERDLHLHIYLENQILHPRATAMEAGVRV
ncbi:iron-sulfur cluster repair di-iron protein [Geothrix oryzae]|uniref:Iron-sulfur cluster repair di-iron protein n=1 Tax=Geothrix oryzae TaxID=2927975 RepID=A0ABM8DNJ4_9BACT|nr:iron-sulfur cluster repair di-iron protein [Geothrix oryzae]BDU68523.1 iron-sulfur cluster repair di-iron protein [Geothrix oryzae]